MSLLSDSNGERKNKWLFAWDIACRQHTTARSAFVAITASGNSMEDFAFGEEVATSTRRVAIRRRSRL